VAYSLAVVRLVLVPVIFLAVYSLFEMGLIVDRIVNVGAPVATLAEQASVQMLDARGTRALSLSSLSQTRLHNRTSHLQP